MARFMGKSERLFRAVVVRAYADGRVVKLYHGPFTAKAPATSMINGEKATLARQQWAGWSWQGAYSLATHVEQSDPTWEETP